MAFQARVLFWVCNKGCFVHVIFVTGWVESLCVLEATIPRFMPVVINPITKFLNVERSITKYCIERTQVYDYIMEIIYISLVVLTA